MGYIKGDRVQLTRSGDKYWSSCPEGAVLEVIEDQGNSTIVKVSSPAWRLTCEPPGYVHVDAVHLEPAGNSSLTGDYLLVCYCQGAIRVGVFHDKASYDVAYGTLNHFLPANSCCDENVTIAGFHCQSDGTIERV